MRIKNSNLRGWKGILNSGGTLRISGIHGCREMRTIAIVTVFLVCLAGCGRLTACRHGNDYGLYPGVRYDCKVMRFEHSAFGTMAAISLPFDFVADTVMLPRDIVRDIIISRELVVMEYKLGPGNEEVWEFVAAGQDIPEEIIELNEAKARNENRRIVITKKRQYVIENWFSYVGNSVTVERGCDKVIRFTEKE